MRTFKFLFFSCDNKSFKILYIVSLLGLKTPCILSMGLNGKTNLTI